MRPGPSGYTSFTESPSTVAVAHGIELDSPGCGSLVLPTSLGGQLTLTNTLLVAALSTNLFSVRAADRAGGDIRFFGGAVTVVKDGVLVAKGNVNRDDHYELAQSRLTKEHEGPATQAANVAYGKASHMGDLWHRRFGHLEYQNVDRVAKIVIGMRITNSYTKTDVGVISEPYVKARMHVHPHGRGE